MKSARNHRRPVRGGFIAAGDFSMILHFSFPSGMTPE